MKKISIYLIIFFIATQIIATQAFAQVSKWENQANQAMISSDYKKAVSLYTKVLENSPKHKSALFSRGLAYLYTSQYKASKADMTRLIGIDPSNADAHNALGLINGYLGDLDAALSSFSKAISLDSKFTEAYINRGSAYIAVNKGDKALNDLTQAIKLNKKNPSTYFQRGRLFYHKEQFGKALKDYLKAIDLGLERPEIYKSIGDIYFKEKKYKQAVKQFTNALKLNPKYVDALNNRAVSYEKLGNTSKANADREKINKFSGGKFPLFKNLKFKRYKSINNDYSFKFPTGWNRFVSNENGENKMLITPEKVKDIDSPYYSGISITMIKDMQGKYGVSEDMDMYNFWRASVMKNAENYVSYNVVQTNKKMVGQYFMHNTTVTVQYSPEMVPFTMYEVTFTKAGELIYAYFQSTEQQFPYYKKIFDRALKSILIK